MPREYNHLPAVIRTVAKRHDDVAEGVAKAAVRNAKVHAPVLTGNLKLTIHAEKTGPNAWAAVADTQHADRSQRAYAQYVEYGTRYAHAQPFMTPAYVEARVTALPSQAALFGARVEAAAITGRTM